MSAVLVAGIGCHSRAHYSDAQRLTWVPQLGVEHRFFFGNPAKYAARVREHHDEIWLPTGDDYFTLADKVQASLRWALDNKFHSIFLVDDDTYVNGANLRAALGDWEKYQYAGRQRPDSRYLSGAAYYLGQKAMNVLADAVVPSTVTRAYGLPAFPYLEGWIDYVLRQEEIEAKPDSRIKFSNVSIDKKVEVEPVEADTVADFEWSGLDMFARHNHFSETKVTPSIEWRLRNLEFQASNKNMSLQEKTFK
jgi:hypothetical protein